MLPEIGTYIARPLEWSIKAEDGKCPQLMMKFECMNKRENNAWSESQGETITGYFTLINKNGNPNEININALIDSLGWDGASFGTLENGNWSHSEVQIVVDQRQGNDGKMYREVKYINPRDYAGKSIEKADPSSIQSLDMKYGAMLRAMRNGKPIAKPAMPAKPTDPYMGSKDQAWSAFQKKIQKFAAEQPDQAYTQNIAIEVFKGILSELYPNTDLNKLRPDQWKDAVTKIENDFSPAIRALMPI